MTNEATHIVCTEQTDCPKYGHIMAVGTNDRKSFTVEQVWRLLDLGHVFYTYGAGKVALVRKHTCGCGRRTLRSEADSTTVNNLDSLPLCPWAA